MKNSNNNIYPILEENKRLLHIDLCARLPYGVIINVYNEYSGTMKDEKLNVFYIDSTYNIEYNKLRPYLRSMSSMTEKEIKELKRISRTITIPGVGDWDKWLTINPIFVDYLNSHHLDWRGLISKGLALEAPKEMYIAFI